MDKTPIFGLHLSAMDFFSNLAFIFGTKAIDNILKIPSKSGTGIIRKFGISTGIDLIFFDFYLKHKTALKKIMAVPGENKRPSAICILTPNHLFITSKDQENQSFDKDIPVLIFTSAPNDLDFTILPDLRIKAVFINFKLESLERECKEEEMNLHDDLKELLSQKKHLFFKEQAPAPFYHHLTELHDHATQNRTNKLVIKFQAVSMVLSVIRQVLAKQQYEDDNNKLLYTKMETVKEMLEKYLETKLPPIPVIARKAAVSESTLKRNFKHVFGTSIYEYYLQIKMERARELFAEQPFSVKEVAYKLGYEKTSSFIKMFKRFYNFSPGELKRKIITN